MLNPQIVEISLEGTIPSKKNSRINTRDGLSFPSKKFSEWQDRAIVDVRRQTRARFLGHIQIEVILYFATLGKADTDNKVTSLLDMLVETMVLKDDYWESVARTVIEAAYRPGKAGAFIRITALPDDYFGNEYLEASKKRTSKRRN